MIAAVILYPASFGPACWIAYRMENEAVLGTVDAIYFPFFWLRLTEHGNSSIRSAIGWYMGLGYPDEPEAED